MSLLLPPRPHRANQVHIADFAEIECMRRADKSVSPLDIARILNRSGDEDGDPSESIQDIVGDCFNDIASRRVDAGGDNSLYPFRITEDGSLVSLANFGRGASRTGAYLYLFLLFATRLNMKRDRLQGGVDGTIIFEHLCKEVCIRYWGGPTKSVAAYVFGTGRGTEELQDHEAIDPGSFENKVKELCKLLGEGEDFRVPTDGHVTARDGKLDVVVWRSFADERCGKLIGFGQCKTGTHWHSDLAKLRPGDFFHKWALDRPAVEPVRLYFVTDRVKERWKEHAIDGGILFDRCRIMEYSTGLPTDLVDQIKTWVNEVLAVEKLSV